MSKNRLAGPVIAVVISLAFIAWMVSGGNESPAGTTVSAAPVKNLTPSVQVVTSLSQPVSQTLEINGVTEANRYVTVRSEANGKIVKLLKKQGDTVTAGEVIAQIDLQDLPARLRQARAFQEQTRLEYEGTQKIVRQGLQNEAQLAQALANYEQAKAQLVGLELQRANTDIKAPFSGRIENMQLELGSFVRQGDSIADVYDYSRLTFIGSVAEKDITSLELDQTAIVELINGEFVNGTVRYIGSVTNPATRTFTVEIDIPSFNKNVSGITSVARINLDDGAGHYVSPALLFINEEGQMGMKLIDASDQVIFREVEIIRSGTQGVWVEGLPNRANIIVVGQGFVNVGDLTNPTLSEFDPNNAVGL